jgi:hypothetical protein
MTYTTAELEWLACRTAELVCDQFVSLGAARNGVATGLVDVATVASTLSVSQKFVRAHALELGGRRVAGRWRFDLSVALAVDTQPPAPQPTVRRPRPTRQSLPQSNVPLLPIRGVGVNSR